MPNYKNLELDNKYVSVPLIFKNEHFGYFKGQYSVFQEQVRFSNCVFFDDVVFGDEANDEAFCELKKDLIFENCVFKGLVLLDGICSNGHIIFNNCNFEYEPIGNKFALSISNSQIKIGIGLYNVVLHGGINFSAMSIEHVGCQFNNVFIDNPNCELNFSKAYFARELSIKFSYINCKTINLENTSVNSNQGSIQLGGGGFIESIDSECISRELFAKTYGFNTDSLNRFYTFYHKIVGEKKYLIICKELPCKSVNVSDEILIKSLSLIQNFMGNYSKIYIQYRDNIDFDGLKPIGDFIISTDDNNLYFSTHLDDCYYISDLETNKINTYSIKEYAPFIFNNIKSKDNSFESSSHNFVEFNRMKDKGRTTHIAIFDNQQNYKLYQWNTIITSTPIDLSQTLVGVGLYVKQTELISPKVCLKGITSEKDILWEDIICVSNIIEASDASASNFVFNNIHFKILDDFQGYWENDEEIETSYVGLKLNGMRISKHIELRDFIFQTNESYDRYTIDLRSVKIDGALVIECPDNESKVKVGINLSGSSMETFKIRCLLWNKIGLNVLNCEIKSICINGVYLSSLSPRYSNWGKIKNGIISSINVFEGKIQFLKTIENIFYNSDNSDWIKVWKFRNNVRLKIEHKRLFPLYKFINKYVLNYGLNAWYLIFWLLAIVGLFDTIVCYKFGLSVDYCVANGFVEFLPTDFNSPIMEQLRSEYSPDGLSVYDILNNAFYSKCVIAYRVVSYTLLSVLIAAFGGYFKGKNS